MSRGLWNILLPISEMENPNRITYDMWLGLSSWVLRLPTIPYSHGSQLLHVQDWHLSPISN